LAWSGKGEGAASAAAFRFCHIECTLRDGNRRTRKHPELTWGAMAQLDRAHLNLIGGEALVSEPADNPYSEALQRLLEKLRSVAVRQKIIEQTMKRVAQDLRDVENTADVPLHKRGFGVMED
jgi:hypothetical protein